MAARVIEVIVLGKDQASGVLGKIGGSLSGLGSVAAGVATGGLALAAAAVVGLGAAAVGATVGITKLAFAAAEVEGTRRTFETLTKDLGGSKKAMEAMKEATRGMVNQADLMAASNKFLTMGLTETIEETAEMSEMATQLGMAMGTDATKSMEDFALMMANQSIPRLDTFGISSARVRERIDELQAATEGLGREEAFKIAVMEQGRIAMQRVGEQSDSAAATTLRWRTAIDDLKLGIGQAFVPALEAIRGPILELVEQYGPKVVEWAKVVGEWLAEKLPRAIEIFTDFAGKVIWAFGTIFRTIQGGSVDVATLLDIWAEFFGVENIETVQKIATVIVDFIDGFQEAFRTKGPAALSAFGAAWEVIRATILAVLAVFKEQVWPMWLAAFQSLAEAMKKLGIDWGFIWTAIGTTLKVVAVVIGTVIIGLIALMTGFATSVANTVAHIATVLENMAATFRLALDSISQIVRGAMMIIKGIFTLDMDLIRQGWNTWLGGMDGAVRAIFQGIINFFNLTFGTLLAAVSGFVEGIVGFFRGLYDRLVGGSIIPEMMDRLVSIFTSSLRNALDIVLGWRDRLVSIFTTGLQDAINRVKDAFGRLTQALEPVRHWIIVIRDAFNSTLGVFNEIRHWIAVLVEKFNHFKSTLAGFSLPWWLTPGSPTPLETGLEGIGKMLAEVQGLATGGLNFGGMTLTGAGAVGGGGGGVTTISITNNFGPGSIRSDEDVLAVANATIRSLELRGIGPVL